MIEKRLRPRRDPQAYLRRWDAWVTRLGGRPVEGGVRDGVHFAEYRWLGISFRILVRDSRFGKPPPMTIVEVPHRSRSDALMTTALLLSRDHQFVCQAPLPAFVKQPEVVLWGDRMFVRIGDRRYREVFGYVVTQPVIFEPPAPPAPPGMSAKAET